MWALGHSNLRDRWTPVPLPPPVPLTTDFSAVRRNRVLGAVLARFPFRPQYCSVASRAGNRSLLALFLRTSVLVVGSTEVKSSAKLRVGDIASSNPSRSSKNRFSNWKLAVRILSTQPTSQVSRFFATPCARKPANTGFFARRSVSGIAGFEPKFPFGAESLSRFPRKWPFCRVKKWRLVRSSTEW